MMKMLGDKEFGTRAVSRKKDEKTEKQKEHDEFIQELRKSAELLGYLHPVLKTPYGIAAGNTRLEADPNWTVKEVPVDSKYDFYLLTAGDNFREEKDDAWWADILLKAANELLNTGTPKGMIAKKLHDDFPVGINRLSRLLPPEFKDPHQVAAAQALAQKRKAAAYDKIKEKEQEEKEERERKKAEEEAEKQAVAEGKVFTPYKETAANVVLPADAMVPPPGQTLIIAQLVQNGINFTSPAIFAGPEIKGRKIGYAIPVYLEFKGKRAIGLDIEGPDDRVRQSYFKDRKINLIRIPKQFAMAYSNILVQVIRAMI